MRKLNPQLRARLESLPISEDELRTAIEYMAMGEAIAEALQSIRRLFEHRPKLTPATH